MTALPPAASSPRIRLWDAPVRVVHWSIAVLLFLSWWTQENDLMAWHRRSGYALAALLSFRLFWGLYGSQTARFAGFVKGPRQIAAYLRGRAGEVYGHNPLGALSVIALLTALAAQIGMGLFSIDDEAFEAGPLARFISFDAARSVADAHEWGFRILLALIVLHVATVGFYLLRGKNLVGPMITGWKRTPLAMPAFRAARPWALVAGLLLAAGVFAALLWLNAQAHLG